MYSVVIKDLNKSFGAVQVLKDINLSAAAGEFIVLLGPSGCGKSTLLRLIAGLEEEHTGEIYIGDRMVSRLDPKDRRVAMVFQSYALYPHMSVRENISFGLRINHVPKAEIERAVNGAAELLQITPLLERKPSELSGGQRQRVAIGRALVRQPDLFLFDEPLSNLDAKLRVDMRAEIKKLHAKLGVTVVYVTHDQIEAMTLATRVVLMRDGVILQLSTPQDLYNKPETVFAARFVGSSPINLVEGILRLGSLGTYVDTALGTLAVPDYAFVGQAMDGASVLVGIRPEAITVARPGDANMVTLNVEFFEPMGSETICTFKLGEGSITAKLAPNAHPVIGQPLSLTLDLSQVSLFDKASEARL